MNFRYKCSRTTRMNVGTAFSSIPPSCRKVSSMEIQKRGTAEWLLNGSTYHNGEGGVNRTDVGFWMLVENGRSGGVAWVRIGDLDGGSLHIWGRGDQVDVGFGILDWIWLG